MQATATRISWPAAGGETCSADVEDAGEEVPTPDLLAGTDRNARVSGLDWPGDETVPYACGDLTGGVPLLLLLRVRLWERAGRSWNERGPPGRNKVRL
jgi:hypothetical protein